MLKYQTLSLCAGGPWTGSVAVPGLRGGEFFPKGRVVSELVNDKNLDRNIALTGGEPLSHPDILEILHEINRRNYKRVMVRTTARGFEDIDFLSEVIARGAYMFEVMPFAGTGGRDAYDKRNIRRNLAGLTNIRRISNRFDSYRTIYLALVVPVDAGSYTRLIDILKTVFDRAFVDRVIFCWGDPGFNISEAGVYLRKALDFCVSKEIWACARGIPACALSGSILNMEELYAGDFTKKSPLFDGACRGCVFSKLCAVMPKPGARPLFSPKPAKSHALQPFVADLIEKGFIFDKENARLYSTNERNGI
ncbi:MAG: hypothetical protein ABII64_07845 [Elusimicrobiota bacterium]